MTGPTIPMIVFFIAVGYTLYYSLKVRHLERMARIENGMEEPTPLKANVLLLNLGLFLVFLGIGLLSAFGCARYFNVAENIFIPAFLLLFGGASMLLAYVIHKKSIK